MRPVSRKAFKGLLIAVTLGLAVALLVRARRAAPRAVEPPLPEPDFTPEPVRPVRERRTADRETAKPAAVPPPAEVSPVPTRPSPAEAADAPPPAEHPATAPEVVEIDPDRMVPVAVADRTPPQERPVRTRRPQLVVGGVLLAFLVAAAAVGMMAFNTLADDKGDDAAPAAATSTTSGAPRLPSSTVSALGPLAAQKFTSQGTRSGGSLNHLALEGRRSNVTGDVWVWLPPQYQRDEMRTKRFPVLVVHSSYPGVGANSLLEAKSGLLAKLVDGVANGTLPPFVVVAPELTPYEQSRLDGAADPEALDTECSDIPGHPRMQTFHNEDVREAVAATFRVAVEPASWALLGEGTGGLCAVKYALQYPQYYTAAASLSGRTALRSPLWPSSGGVREAQEPLRLLTDRPDVSLFLGNAAADNAGRQASTAFRDAAKTPTIVETGTASGEPSKQIPVALAFLDRNVTDSTLASGVPVSNTSPSGTPTASSTSTRRPSGN